MFKNNSIAVISQRRSEASSFPNLGTEIKLDKQSPSPELCKAVECSPQSKGMRDVPRVSSSGSWGGMEFWIAFRIVS